MKKVFVRAALAALGASAGAIVYGMYLQTAKDRRQIDRLRTEISNRDFLIGQMGAQLASPVDAMSHVTVRSLGPSTGLHVVTVDQNGTLAQTNEGIRIFGSFDEAERAAHQVADGNHRLLEQRWRLVAEGGVYTLQFFSQGSLEPFYFLSIQADEGKCYTRRGLWSNRTNNSSLRRVRLPFDDSLPTKLNSMMRLAEEVEAAALR